MTKTLDDLIKSVAREIALRKNVYPKWTQSVNGRKPRMTPEQAAHEIACMEDVVKLLNEEQAFTIERERRGFEIECLHCWLAEALTDSFAVLVERNPGKPPELSLEQVADHMGRVIGEIILQYDPDHEGAFLTAVEAFEREMREAVARPKPLARRFQA